MVNLMSTCAYSIELSVIMGIVNAIYHYLLLLSTLHQVWAHWVKLRLSDLSVECKSDQFSCPIMETCLSFTQVCNRQNDCNNEEEVNCGEFVRYIVGALMEPC